MAKQQDPLPLRMSYSADTRHLSPTSPPHPDSNGSRSTSSTSSLKRRRSERMVHKARSTQRLPKKKDGEVDGMVWAQKKPKDLSLPSIAEKYDTQGQRQSTGLPYRAGDQVEAIRVADEDGDETKSWCCARVVEIDETPFQTRLFVHYEGWSPEQADWVRPSDVRPVTKAVRFGPRGKENDASWKDFAAFYYGKMGASVRAHTGLVQDCRMNRHCCPCHSRETVHPERPDRIGSILQQLHGDRLLRFVRRIRAREATLAELLLVHAAGHVRNYCPIELTAQEAVLNSPGSLPPSPQLDPPPSSPLTRSQRHGSIVGPTRGVGGGVVIQADNDQIKRQRRRFSTASTHATPALVAPPGLVCKMTCGELGIAVDTTFHPLYSSLSARVAAGSLIRLVDEIVDGHLRNGFALIRPPGHHAEDDSAMGFCFFNNIAVAVATTLDKHPSIKKALVIDWDIHHGNGTQKIFYDNPNVLYISLHRWEKGQFYPFSGAPDECGEGPGLGKNINIAFNECEEKPRPMGDAEFVAAFYHLIMPIARQFGPDMIFVSAGFDAAEGHPENLGGYNVTPRGYSIMSKMVKELAEELCDGRLVLTLEGGYELQPLAISAAASVAQLLPPGLAPEPQLDYRHSLNAIKPNQGAVDSLLEAANVQKKYWNLPRHLFSPGFRFHLPEAWRAPDSISTRPRREKRPRKVPIVEGY